ncbi:hypothetical protein NUZ5A_20118 [Candidatus Nitrosotenuis uzonensis]|uniref:Uncharacterized protein n=1 Tax=Candidatus Nitrosotenuis uzonensis TaxID=1407055 RepID=A0A812EU08_9ARCH|nr:hypothetical protein NUZ5A_20118 [Candidatus Nitrosotenuis uzonensis]
MSFENLSKRAKLIYLAIGIGGLVFFIVTVFNGT